MSLILEDFEGLASEAQFNRCVEDVVMKLLGKYRRTSQAEEDSTGDLRTAGSLLSDCGNFYKSTAAAFRAKKVAAAKKKETMTPEECLKFLMDQLKDESLGYSHIEEKFRKPLMLHEVYLEDQLPPPAYPMSNARQKTKGKATTLKPLVLSNVSVAASAAAASRDGAVQIAAMGKAATESIATTLNRLGISAVGQPVLAFVIVVPATTGDEEAAIPSGTARLTIDGQEKVGDWTKAILLSLDPPKAVLRTFVEPTPDREEEVHMDQLRAIPEALGRDENKKPPHPADATRECQRISDNGRRPLRHRGLQG